MLQPILANNNKNSGYMLFTDECKTFRLEKQNQMENTTRKK